MMYTNPYLDIVNINAYSKLCEIISIERKWKYEGLNVGRNDGQPKSSFIYIFKAVL